jgi:hypothetical protein
MILAFGFTLLRLFFFFLSSSSLCVCQCLNWYKHITTRSIFDSIQKYKYQFNPFFFNKITNINHIMTLPFIGLSCFVSKNVVKKLLLKINLKN